LISFRCTFSVKILLQFGHLFSNTGCVFLHLVHIKPKLKVAVDIFCFKRFIKIFNSKIELFCAVLMYPFAVYMLHSSIKAKDELSRKVIEMYRKQEGVFERPRSIQTVRS
jgi:hypothetical protein